MQILGWLSLCLMVFLTMAVAKSDTQWHIKTVAVLIQAAPTVYILLTLIQ